MKILVIAATVFEIAPLLNHLENKFKKVSFFEFESEKHTIYPLVTGVGMVNTAFGMARFQSIQAIDVAFNVGICGSFDTKFSLGEVFEITKDRFGDLGVEEVDGGFTDVFALELIDKNYFPYEDGWLINDKLKLDLSLPHATAITVNKVHGNKDSIERIKSIYPVDLESMEGAAFFYACKSMDVKCHQVRSVSNYVEPRNRANWQLDLAIENLNKKLIEIINS